jgi:iron complex transport system ATP-binding protein
VTALAASGILVQRGGRAIVDNVSLRAQSEEFVAIVGANGAGKSTLLAVLAGLLKPEAGIVRLNDVPLTELPRTALARRRAYLPQNPRCEWPISVERLVALGLTPTLPTFGGLATGDRIKVTRVLESCDLLDRREQTATSLSGGELARAMLARAFVGDPDILIVDEPLAGLDPRHAIEIANRLQAFARAGKLVIASIHDMTLAARYATRLVALRQGKVLCDGPAEAILTPEMIRSVFDVEARVLGGTERPYVDYVSP